MMKWLLLPLAFFSGLHLAAQDFRFEARFYLLQDYIRQHAIRTISVGRSSDSLEARMDSGLTLEFDELGRLSAIQEPVNSAHGQRVLYGYEGQNRMYSMKHYERLAESPVEAKRVTRWEIVSNEDHTRTNEVLTLTGGDKTDTLRQNLLLFDELQRMVYRQSLPDGSSNVLIAKFSYNAEGTLSRFQSAYALPHNPDSSFGGEVCDFRYDALGRVSDIAVARCTNDDLQRWNRRISFHYAEAGTVFVADSSGYIAKHHENYELITKYNGRVNFYSVAFNQEGLVALIRESQSYSKGFSYLAFTYTFYEGLRVRESGASAGSEFLLYYFAPLDWKQMY